MVSPQPHRRWYALGATIAVLGTAAIAGSISWQWRHIPYGLGVAALAIGCVILVVVAVRRTVWRVVASVAVAALVVTGGVVAITGTAPQTPPHWDSYAGGPSESSARAGDLLISQGTAYDVSSGNIVWSIDGDHVDPMLVRSDIVVLSTSDQAIAIDPLTGDELWNSPIFGSGIATSGNILVVSHPVSDSEFEAVALDLTTGETVWQRPGRPVMECSFGKPIDRFAVAPEQSHVLVSGDRKSERADLLTVADGTTAVADVNCSLIARMAGGVLLEAGGDTLLGRSPTDGTRLWSAHIERPWIVEGGGSQVFAMRTSGEDSVQLTAIDITSGQANVIEPPAGRLRYLTGTEAHRSTDVWLVVDLEAGAAMWNPGNDAFVTIPDAESIDDYRVDAYSGWIALSGRTRDFTGDVTRFCWAISPDGQLFGPAPGPGCYVNEGIMDAGHEVYPLK